LEQTAFQQALEFVAARKNMGLYWTMMDFLFCEIFPHPWKSRCLRYYRDRGLQLAELLAGPEVVRCDRVLVLALRMAGQRMRRRRDTGWGAFRQEVLLAA